MDIYRTPFIHYLVCPSATLDWIVGSLISTDTVIFIANVPYVVSSVVDLWLMSFIIPLLFAPTFYWYLVSSFALKINHIFQKCLTDMLAVN